MILSFWYILQLSSVSPLGHFRSSSGFVAAQYSVWNTSDLARFSVQLSQRQDCWETCLSESQLVVSGSPGPRVLELGKPWHHHMAQHPRDTQ